MQTLTAQAATPMQVNIQTAIVQTLTAIPTRPVSQRTQPPAPATPSAGQMPQKHSDTSAPPPFQIPLHKSCSILYQRRAVQQIFPVRWKGLTRKCMGLPSISALVELVDQTHLRRPGNPHRFRWNLELSLCHRRERHICNGNQGLFDSNRIQPSSGERRFKSAVRSGEERCGSGRSHTVIKIETCYDAPLPKPRLISRGGASC